MEVLIVGLDCATEAASVGAALGDWRAGAVTVRQFTLCGTRPPVAVVSDWLSRCDRPALLALDAPLATALAQHQAGGELEPEANAMFRRRTDRFIYERLGKTPLDVGADRIAHTAHAALRLLAELRPVLESPISLAWSREHLAGVQAIEVYPAATLISHRIRASGYKKPPNVAERREIIVALRTHLRLPVDVLPLESNADVLDAVVCLPAAKDFLEGRAVPPEDYVLAEREGWIWAAQAGADG